MPISFEVIAFATVIGEDFFQWDRKCGKLGYFNTYLLLKPDSDPVSQNKATSIYILYRYYLRLNWLLVAFHKVRRTHSLELIFFIFMGSRSRGRLGEI